MFDFGPKPSRQGLVNPQRQVWELSRTAPMQKLIVVTAAIFALTLAAEAALLC